VLDAAGDRSGRIAAHRRMLERFEAVAERLADCGEAEDAISAVAVGAHVGSLFHSGVLASARLEAVLRRIAEEHLQPLVPRDRPASPRRVLHVATETYGVGGHTRVIWRWIGRDAERVHDVVLTGQRTSVPDGLVAAANASGGRVMNLGPDAPWLDRARALRELAADADAVVLYTHHRDPVPTLAFSAAGDRPPTITYNHADHMLWLGYSVTDLLQCCRPNPANAMRGVPAERVFVTPFPVTGPEGNARSEPASEGERAAARAGILPKLGWPDDTVLVLTVGSAHKYFGPRGATLLDMIGSALEEHPDARLLAVGARDEGAFRELRERTGGRLLAIGPMAGIATLFDAADLYVESWPFGGQGATAEAAAAGLPVLSYGPSEVEASLLCTHPMYGANLSVTPEEYRRTFGELLSDPARRTELAARSHAAVTESDAAWEAGTEETYRLAAELGPVAPDELLEPAGGPDPIHVLADVVQEEIAARHADVEPERAIASFELAARDSRIRNIFGSLHGPHAMPAVSRRYEVAFAAPPPDPGSLREAVDEFRRLALIGAADRYVLALRPDDAGEAVPVLEAALADGSDVDVDLMLDDDPASLRPDWALDVSPAPAAPS
jgi:glycosyltransferase involved in cell wall biosynthesis